MPRLEDVKAKLDAVGIPYTLSHHEPTRTSEEASRVRGVPMHAGAKAIVTRGHKSGTVYLFVMPADLKLDGVKAKKLVGEPIGFASDVEAITGCVPGSVPPFGSLFGAQTYMDARLGENAEIHFNAGSLTDSMCIRFDDYLRAEQPIVTEIAKVV